TWNGDRLAALLRECTQAQGRLLGMSRVANDDTALQDTLDTLLQNIITSSAIEGEQLNVGSVRSSLARRLGLDDDGKRSPRSEGLAELMLDVTQANAQPLTLQRLFTWHRWLFPTQETLASHQVQ
ncbi:DUF4172 domain-containing protein, partial [Pseudomonas viridiflava]